MLSLVSTLAEGSDPVVPTGFETMLVALGVAYFVLLLAAIFAIARDRELSAPERAVWLIVVILLPYIGPILWFIAALSRRHARGGVGSLET